MGKVEAKGTHGEFIIDVIGSAVAQKAAKAGNERVKPIADTQR